MEVSGKFAKFLYLMVMFATIVVAISSKFGFADLYSYSSFDTCNGADACQGNQAVYRYSFALAVWFVIIAIGVRGNVDVHYSYWGFKFAAFAGLIIAALFIPGGFFSGYAEFARIVSIVFLLLQIFIIIDSAYRLHEYLLAPTETAEGEESTSSCGWQVLYLAICFVLLAVSLGGIIVLYMFYKCPLAQFFITFTLILSILVTLYSVLDSVGVGLMVPSAVSAYATFLCWQSLHSMPDAQCNPQADAPDNLGTIIVGLVIAGLSLVYTAFTTSHGMARLFHQSATTAPEKEDPAASSSGEPKKNMSENVDKGDTVAIDMDQQPKGDGSAAGLGGGSSSNAGGSSGMGGGSGATGSSMPNASSSAAAGSSATAGNDPDGGDGKKGIWDQMWGSDDEERANTERNRKNHWRFHWLMAMGAVYGAMLLTNWGATEGGSQSANTDVSLESMWVKIISQWLTFALFIWTIVAPRVCPSRDFSGGS